MEQLEENSWNDFFKKLEAPLLAWLPKLFVA
jgi:hypothetical protein